MQRRPSSAHRRMPLVTSRLSRSFVVSVASCLPRVVARSLASSAFCNASRCFAAAASPPSFPISDRREASMASALRADSSRRERSCVGTPSVMEVRVACALRGREGLLVKVTKRLGEMDHDVYFKFKLMMACTAHWHTGRHNLKPESVLSCATGTGSVLYPTVRVSAVSPGRSISELFGRRPTNFKLKPRPSSYPSRAY